MGTWRAQPALTARAYTIDNVWEESRRVKKTMPRQIGDRRSVTYKTPKEKIPAGSVNSRPIRMPECTYEYQEERRPGARPEPCV